MCYCVQSVEITLGTSLSTFINQSWILHEICDALPQAENGPTCSRVQNVQQGTMAQVVSNGYFAPCDVSNQDEWCPPLDIGTLDSPNQDMVLACAVRFNTSNGDPEVSIVPMGDEVTSVLKNYSINASATITIYAISVEANGPTTATPVAADWGVGTVAPIAAAGAIVVIASVVVTFRLRRRRNANSLTDATPTKLLHSSSHRTRTGNSGAGGSRRSLIGLTADGMETHTSPYYTGPTQVGTGLSGASAMYRGGRVTARIHAGGKGRGNSAPASPPARVAVPLRSKSTKKCAPLSFDNMPDVAGLELIGNPVREEGKEAVGFAQNNNATRISLSSAKFEEFSAPISVASAAVRRGSYFTGSTASPSKLGPGMLLTTDNPLKVSRKDLVGTYAGNKRSMLPQSSRREVKSKSITRSRAAALQQIIEPSATIPARRPSVFGNNKRKSVIAFLPQNAAAQPANAGASAVRSVRRLSIRQAPMSS